MAFQAHCKVKGKKQGAFKGEGIQTNRMKEWFPVLEFSMGIKSPRDAATGQPSGKRQFDPVGLVKEWGAASPQGLNAVATNEILPTVNFEFTQTDQNGAEVVYQTVTLTNATISKILRYTGSEGGTEGSSSSKHTSAVDTMELERWEFTFQKIEVADNNGKTSFMDDWASTI